MVWILTATTSSTLSPTDSIAIAGLAGRMGRTLFELANESGLPVSGGTEAPGSPALGEALTIGSASLTPVAEPAMAAQSATVWIDFTRPAATLSALDALRDTGVRGVVIGTTGFSEAETDAIAAAADRFAIVKAGNFSLGIALLCALTKQAATALGSDWDIDILETHHRHKIDAPSGTALMLGEAAAEGRGTSLKALKSAPYEGQDAKRVPGEIGFAVRRTGGVIGEHDVLLANTREAITLSHKALDRAVFADGALQAARWVAAQPPGLYTIEDVLGL